MTDPENQRENLVAAQSSEEAKLSVAVALRTLDVVEDILATMTSRAGRDLNAADIREVFRSLRHSPGLLPSLLETKERPGLTFTWVRNPFSRALVTPFEHLLSSPPEIPVDENHPLSRRFLPGFFVAFRLMIGSQPWEEAETRVKEIVSDEGVTDLMGHDVIRTEVFAMYAKALNKLENTDKHVSWLVRIINSRLSKLESEYDSKDGWTFTLAHLKQIFREALCESATSDEPSAEFKSRVTDALGNESYEQAQSVLASILSQSEDA